MVSDTLLLHAPWHSSSFQERTCLHETFGHKASARCEIINVAQWCCANNYDRVTPSHI